MNVHSLSNKDLPPFLSSSSVFETYELSSRMNPGSAFSLREQELFLDLKRELEICYLSQEETFSREDKRLNKRRTCSIKKVNK